MMNSDHPASQHNGRHKAASDESGNQMQHPYLFVDPYHDGGMLQRRLKLAREATRHFY
jgi:hypothetical protein